MTIEAMGICFFLIAALSFLQDDKDFKTLEKKIESTKINRLHF